MSDLENPNPGNALSFFEAANPEVPSAETTTTVTSLNAPDITEQEARAVALERQRLQRMFMEFLNSSFSIEDDDDGDDDDDDDDDGDDDQQPTRCMLCCTCFREKVHRLLNIIAYPFMILFTIISLVMIVTFCILPTLFCMTFGICAYYCFMEDPMSLHMLLRYMFSPDDAAEAAFANGNGSSLYPMNHNRTILQSKLIVRRLMKVTNSDDRNDEDDNEGPTKKYPRRHPSSILIWTESKCLQFSPPLVFEEESDEDENDERKKKKRKRYCRRRRTGDISPSSGEGDVEVEGEGVDSRVIVRIPHDQQSRRYARSIRNSHESTPETVAIERNDGEEDMIAEIPLRASPEVTLAQEDEEINSDEEMGNVPISVGHDGDGFIENEEEGNGDDSRSSTGTVEQPTGVESNDIPVCQDCNDDVIVSLQKTHDSRPNPLEEDYFGIETDVRDRHTACDICLLEYEIGDKVAWSPNPACSHTYHNDCVLDW
jgi:hypothetical protein